MARPRKTDSFVLLQIIEDFYEKNGDGAFAKLKYRRLEQYAAEKGCAAKEYDFRRDNTVRKRIDELRKLAESPSCGASTVAYKTLDYDGIIKNCSTIEELRSRMLDMDRYWKRVYDAAVSSSAEIAELTLEKGRMVTELMRLEKENAELKSGQAGSVRDVHALQRENAYLRRMLRTYLYPELAGELLRENNLPAEENTSVCPEAFKKLIDGPIPGPFDGIQKAKPKSLTRQEKLLEQMKKQVRGDE